MRSLVFCDTPFLPGSERTVWAATGGFDCFAVLAVSSSKPFMMSSKSIDSRLRWILRVRDGNVGASTPPGGWREAAWFGTCIEDSEEA